MCTWIRFIRSIRVRNKNLFRGDFVFVLRCLGEQIVDEHLAAFCPDEVCVCPERAVWSAVALGSAVRLEASLEVWGVEHEHARW